ncbi:hypothetical protein K439DRAFT_1363765 [Ramaria rubella]|nr:hypothetical protein K439DRAFT_1363765 [Ramaria rubella]
MTLSRSQASLLIQLHTGHVAPNKHLATIGAIESSTCPSCKRQDESVHHYLLQCPSYAHQWHCLVTALHRNAVEISYLLSEPDTIPFLFRYIHQTGRFKHVVPPPLSQTRLLVTPFLPPSSSSH